MRFGEWGVSSGDVPVKAHLTGRHGPEVLRAGVPKIQGGTHDEIHDPAARSRRHPGQRPE